MRSTASVTWVGVPTLCRSIHKISTLNSHHHTVVPQPVVSSDCTFLSVFYIQNYGQNIVPFISIEYNNTCSKKTIDGTITHN